MKSLARMLLGCLPALAIGLLSGGATASAACPAVGFTIVDSYLSPQSRPVQVGRHQLIYIRRMPLTSTRDITQIQLLREEGDDATLLIRFTPSATQTLHDATTNHAGRRLAFMFNDDVLINVVWEGRFGIDSDGSQVSMRHGLRKAQALMKAIRGCTASA